MIQAEADQTWMIDRTGRTLSRADLLAGLGSTRRPVCRPVDTIDALMEIIRNLVYGGDLLLVDTDFSDREITELGLSFESINRPESRENLAPVSWLAVERAAQGTSQARIGLYTSGSTGLPKLVWQSLKNLARAVKVSSRHSEAIWALAYNPTHVAGIQVYLQALANGCPVVDVYGLGCAEVLSAIARHGVTHLSGTPSFYRLLLPVEAPLTAVRSVTLGGEIADAQLLSRLREAFPQAHLHNVYASTEAGTLLIADDDVFSIPESLADRIKLQEGRLWVHRSLLGQIENEGVESQRPDWYDTGDVVELVSAEPLRFRIVARDWDWVNVGGSKVNPHEVEAVLLEHPAIREARVFGRKNSVTGNILCAEVVLKKVGKLETEPDARPVTETELRACLAARLQPFKVPRMIRFVENLATTRTGKLSRR